MAKSADDIVKNPHQKDNFSNQKILDLMSCIQDPIFFIENFVKIQHAMRGAIPFKPYPYQIRMLRAFHENRFTIALTSRQQGKCVTGNTQILSETNQIVIKNLIDKLSLKEKLINYVENLIIKFSR